ncbi:MAG: TRAP transporter fused permease subunit [Dehalococcoidia bacterium]|nr:TRAP transporter fused permease subunit [Dehalococcoidia bacterium]
MNQQNILEKEATRFRIFKGPLHVIVISLSIFLVGFLLMYNLGYLTTKELFLYLPQVRALGLLIILVLTFMLMPSRSKERRDTVPWFDGLLIAMVTIPILYYFFTYQAKTKGVEGWNTYELVLGAMLIIAIIEAVRRTMGMVVSILLVVFFIYPIISASLPGFLQGRGYSPARMLSTLYLSNIGIFGDMLHIIITVIFAFLLFAAFLQISGAAQWFTDLALAAAGRFRGGPAKVVIVADTFLGTVTGSAVANVVASGVVTIPLMKRTGYPAHFAAAVEAVSSTGGQLVPPVMGSVAFLMSQLLEIPYWTICVMAIIPSVLYYVALYWQLDFHAVKHKLKGLPPEELPKLKKVLIQGAHYLVPIIVLILFLGVWHFSAERSAFYALITLLVVGLIRKESRINLQKFLNGLTNAAQSMIDIGAVVAGLAIIVTAITLTGLGPNIAGGLVEVSGGNKFILLLLTFVTVYIFGMGLPSVPAYLILAALVAPALVQVGIEERVAHFFIFFYAMLGHITPPVCPAAFAAASLAGAPMMKTGFQSMRLGIVLMIVPFMFVYNPVLLMIGKPVDIIQATITALIGVTLLAGSLEGYLLKSANVVQRVILGAGGLLLVIPGWRTDLIGLALGVSALLWQIAEKRLAAQQAKTTPTLP